MGPSTPEPGSKDKSASPGNACARRSDKRSAISGQTARKFDRFTFMRLQAISRYARISLIYCGHLGAESSGKTITRWNRRYAHDDFNVAPEHSPASDQLFSEGNLCFASGSEDSRPQGGDN